MERNVADQTCGLFVKCDSRLRLENEEEDRHLELSSPEGAEMKLEQQEEEERSLLAEEEEADRVTEFLGFISDLDSTHGIIFIC